MSFQKWISLLALLCFCGALLFLLQARLGREDKIDSPVLAKNPTEKREETKAAKPKDDPRITRLNDGRILLNSSVALSTELAQDTPERDLEIIVQILDQYRLVFAENPAGSENVEIVEQLLGANPQKLVFIDPKHSHLSPTGELLDRWDSPYVFHPLAATAMEILSPGPDKTLWTEDDLVLELTELKNKLQL